MNKSSEELLLETANLVKRSQQQIQHEWMSEF